MAVYLGSHLVSLLGGQPVEDSSLNIKKFTATVSADQTSAYTMLTDPYFLEIRNNPKGFMCMRYMGLASATAEIMFWFTANFVFGYAGSGTAYNSLILRTTASGSLQGNFNVNGLVGDNYNGHINITSSGGLLLMPNATYPVKAGNYEILAGVWE